MLGAANFQGRADKVPRMTLTMALAEDSGWYLPRCVRGCATQAPRGCESPYSRRARRALCQAVGSDVRCRWQWVPPLDFGMNAGCDMLTLTATQLAQGNRGRQLYCKADLQGGMSWRAAWKARQDSPCRLMGVCHAVARRRAPALATSPSALARRSLPRGPPLMTAARACSSLHVRCPGCGHLPVNCGKQRGPAERSVPGLFDWRGGQLRRHQHPLPCRCSRGGPSRQQPRTLPCRLACCRLRCCSRTAGAEVNGRVHACGWGLSLTAWWSLPPCRAAQAWPTPATVSTADPRGAATRSKSRCCCCWELRPHPTPACRH